MMICPKCHRNMDQVLTKAGVIVEACEKCKGVWLDRGELDLFAKNRKLLSDFHTQGLLNPQPQLHKCPRCKVEMKSGQIPGFRHEVEECQTCKGLFFDEHEFKKISESDSFPKLRPDNKVTTEVLKREITGNAKIALPSLGMTSSIVIGFMYAILFGLVVFCIESGLIQEKLGLLILVGFVFLQFLLGPIIMDWSLGLFGSLVWQDFNSLPKSFSASLEKLCKANGLPIPRVGIIQDGSPQAFTYGRTPKSARVVFSRGIFELLDENEVEAVLAHELGHIKHWDFVVMTIAQLVPIICYHIYRICRRIAQKSRGRKNPGPYFMIAALVAFVAYIITHYMMLFVSRVREYHADKFSSYTTKNPNSLLTGLVKIGYGMVTNSKPNENDSSDQQRKMAVQAMGIMSVMGGKEFALAIQGSPGVARDPKTIQEVMKWDLWSPWATYYELNSTHPLTAKRIRALGAYAQDLGQKPLVVFDAIKPESYWDDFLQDLIVLQLPNILALGAAAAKIYLSGGLSHVMGIDLLLPVAIAYAVGGLIKTMQVYPGGGFTDCSIISLLKKVKVSPVRSFPVKIRGRVIGRGEAGSIFNEDMVVRDETGMIFLDHEPFGFNFFFALFKSDRYRGHDVEVEGWYRRSPLPFIEVRNIRSAHDSSSSYTYTYKMLFWLSLPVIAYFLDFYIRGRH